MRIRSALICALFLSPCMPAGASDPAAATADGWEGFYPPDAIDDAWLGRRGIPLKAAVVPPPGTRVVKLVVAYSTRTSPAQELDTMTDRYCSPRRVREWNKELCASLKARRCENGICTYRHFGNCTGFLLGNGSLLTAAHCVFDLASDPSLASASVVVVPNAAGRPAKRLRLGNIRLGKRAWLAEADEDAVDAAAIRIEDGGLEPWPVAPLPPAGSTVFIRGFPRAERRPADSRQRLGYDLVFGVPSVSFGRISDRNEGDQPLCDVDGNQEHWRLASPCPTGEAATPQGTERTGVILRSPFLATYDSSNGYSGAPVFDASGRLIGINDTIVGGENPQDGFFPSTQAVGTPVARALSRLRI